MHLVLVDLRDSELDGQQAEDRLHEIGITVNRNAVPFDPRPPAVSSGLRVGTPPSPPAACRPTTSRRSARSSPGAAAGLRVGPRRARRARDGDRRPLPAVRAAGHAHGGLTPMRRVLASTAAALLLAGSVGAAPSAARSPSRRAELTIATGGKGGIYAVYGAELYKVNSLDGYRGRPLGATGSVQNLLRCATGRPRSRSRSATPRSTPSRGAGVRPPVPMRALAQDLRATSSSSPAPARAAPRGPPGPRVSVSSPDSGTQVSPSACSLAGVEPCASSAQLGVASRRSTRGGAIDAFFWSGGVPTHAITQVAEGTPARSSTSGAGRARCARGGGRRLRASRSPPAPTGSPAPSPRSRSPLVVDETSTSPSPARH